MNFWGLEKFQFWYISKWDFSSPWEKNKKSEQITLGAFEFRIFWAKPYKNPFNGYSPRALILAIGEKRKNVPARVFSFGNGP